MTGITNGAKARVFIDSQWIADGVFVKRAGWKACTVISDTRTNEYGLAMVDVRLGARLARVVVKSCNVDFVRAA